MLLNLKLNIIKQENKFEFVIFHRFIESLDNEKQKFVTDEEDIISNISFGGTLGFILSRCFSWFEVLRLNKLVDEKIVNPYFMATKSIERGLRIERAKNPNGFEIGCYVLKYNLINYNTNVPFIINYDDDYLNAINSYYDKNNIRNRFKSIILFFLT